MNPRHLLVTTLMSLCLPLAGWFAPGAQAQTEVTLGVYSFPPVASVRNNTDAEGLLGDLLAELQADNDDITFRIVHTSPKRRHLDFVEGLYDVAFFESTRWGWDSLPVKATRALLMDEEVYVALNKPGRDQSFVDNISKRRIAVISGYHYGFAGLSTDDSTLEEQFRIEFSDSHYRNLSLIKADRPSLAEVAVVSRSYLRQYLEDNPDDSDTFLVSDVPDQAYQLRIIARDGGPVDVQTLESMLKPLIEDGRYQQMVKDHGLDLPPELAGR